MICLVVWRAIGSWRAGSFLNREAEAFLKIDSAPDHASGVLLLPFETRLKLEPPQTFFVRHVSCSKRIRDQAAAV